MNDAILRRPGNSMGAIGRVFAGLGSAAAGILDVIWGEFEPAHQPIQAWGDRIAHIPMLAYLAAAFLIVGGIALCIRRTAQAGAATLAVIYAIFTLFPLPRLYTAPHFLGYHVAVYIGLLLGVCQQLILFVAAAVVYALLSKTFQLSWTWARVARWTFGLCCIDFGLAHFINVQAVARMVPGWMPLGGASWSIITGAAFVLAGLAILSGIQDVLAARLLGLMLLVFSVVVLTPGIFANPHSHVAWGGDAYNLTAVGSAWMFAGWLADLAAGSRTDKTRERASVPIT